jgi:uncharacterized protein
VDSLEVLEQTLGIAMDFKPMSQQEMAALRDGCKTFAVDGRYELFKTTKKYDGKVGREVDGFPSLEEQQKSRGAFPLPICSCQG